VLKATFFLVVYTFYCNLLLPLLHFIAIIIIDTLSAPEWSLHILYICSQFINMVYIYCKNLSLIVTKLITFIIYNSDET